MEPQAAEAGPRHDEDTGSQEASGAPEYPPQPSKERVGYDPLVTAAQSQSRNNWVELLRVAAALAIVWFHAHAPGYAIAYSGLTVFLVLSLFFEGQRDPSRPFNTVELIQRLLLPWAFWLAVYGILNLALKRPLFAEDETLMRGILYGTSAHLWYLPYVFAMLVLVRGLRRVVSLDVLSSLAVLLAIACIAAVEIWRPWSLAEGPPNAQYTQALPAVLFGLVAANVWSSRISRLQAAAVLAVLCWVATLPLTGVGVPHAIGCALVLAAIALGRHFPLRSKLVETAAPLSFGIFLSHPFFLDVSGKLFERSSARSAVLAFMLSLVFTYVLRAHGRTLGKLVT